MGRDLANKYRDVRGGHVRLYWDILDSAAWLALTWIDQGLYLAMRRSLSNNNNGNVNATISRLRSRGVKSSASLAKSLRALQAVGLIEKTRQGGIAHGVKTCCLYRFTDVEVFEQKALGLTYLRATNEWRDFKLLEHARAAVKAAHLASLRPTTKINTEQLRSASRVDSDGEQIRPGAHSSGEQEGLRLVRSANKTRKVESELQAA